MAEQHTWASLVRQVPGVAEIPPAESPAVGNAVQHLRTQPIPKGGIPPGREELLATIETVTAAPAKRKINRARQADTERRAKAVKDLQPRHAAVWTTIAILLSIAGIVLLLPDPLTAVFTHPVTTLTGEATTYYYNITDAGLLAGAMIAVGAAIHWVLELPRPRSLPYFALIYIPYLLFGIPAASGAVAQWVNHGPFGPLVLFGICLAVGGVLSFAFLLIYGLRSPLAVVTIWRGSEQARELDRQFRTEVRRAIFDNEHVHLDAYRAQTLEGIRLLYRYQLIDSEDALWMLREITPQTAPAD